MHVICAIFDKKVGEYTTPFVVPNVITAIRSLAAALKEGSNLSQYPADFAVYKVGDIDLSTGLITPANPPAIIEELVNIANSTTPSRKEKT